MSKFWDAINGVKTEAVKKKRKAGYRLYKDTYIKRILRQGFLKSELRQGFLRKSKIERGRWVCCKCENTLTLKELYVDHIIPVKTHKDWNEYIDLLFCKEDGLQILCEKCHKLKTSSE